MLPAGRTTHQPRTSQPYSHNASALGWRHFGDVGRLLLLTSRRWVPLFESLTMGLFLEDTIRYNLVTTPNSEKFAPPPGAPQLCHRG